MVSEQSAIVPVVNSLPNTYEIYGSQKTYHTFTVPSVGANNGTVVVVTVGGVQRGSVQLLVSQGTPLSYCPCFRQVHAITVAANSAPQQVVLAYCEITNTGTWTAEIVGLSPLANQSIAYTLTVETRAQTPKALQAGQSSQDNALDGHYVYYALPALGAQAEVLVTLTQVRGGTATIYYNVQNPATSECSSGAVCTNTASSCSAQIGACEPTPNFISVLASANSAAPVFWEISFSVANSTAIPINTELPGVTLQPGFTQQYTLAIPAQSVGPFISVILSNIVNPPLAVTVLQSPCDLLAVSSTCTTSGSCEVDVGSCLIPNAGNFYVVVQSIVPGANLSATVSFDLLVNVVSTGATIIPLATNATEPTTETVSGYQWRMYSINVPSSSEIKQELDITTSTPTPAAVDFYLRYAEDSSFQFPSTWPCQHPTAGNCTGASPCVLSLDSCCLVPGNYLLGVRNKLSAATNFTVQATLTTAAQFVPQSGATSPWSATVTDAPVGLLQEAAFAVYAANLTDATNANATTVPPSSVLTMRVTNTGDAVTGSRTMNVYLQHGSIAGNAPPCYTSYATCTATTSSCVRQFPACSAPSSVLPGTYYVALSNTDNAVNRSLSADIQLSVQQPTTLALGAPPTDELYLEPGAVYQYYMVPQVPATDAAAVASALYTLNVNLTQVNATIGLGASVFVSTLSVCDSTAPPATCTATFATPICIASLPLCTSRGPFYIGVRSTSAFSGTYYTLSAQLVAATPTFDLSTDGKANTLNELVAPASNAYFKVNTTSLTGLTPTSRLQFVLSYTSGTVSAVNLAHQQTGFCFSTLDSCSGRWVSSSTTSDVGNETVTVTTNTCTITISYCAIVANEELLVRVGTLGAVTDTNLTIEYVPVQPVPSVTELVVGGPQEAAALELFGTAYYHVSLADVTLWPGQSLQINASTLCGSVALYVSGNGIAGPDCQLSCSAAANCSSLVFRLAACDIMNDGWLQSTGYYVSVVATSQGFASYGVPTQFYLEASVVGDIESYVLADAGERISFLPPVDLPPGEVPQPYYYMYAIDSLGQYAGNTQFTFEGPSNAVFTLYFDQPPVCLSAASLPSSSASCVVPTGTGNTVIWSSCVISLDSCTLGTRRFVYFTFPMTAATAGITTPLAVTILRPTPYVRNWNTVPSALAAPMRGALARSDIEFYEFSLDPTAIPWFRLTITLKSAGTQLTLAYSTLALPSACSTTNVTTCTSSLITGTCALIFDSCQISAPTITASSVVTTYLSVSSPASVPSLQPYTLSLSTSVTPIALKPDTDRCTQATPNSLSYFSADASNFTIGDTYRVTVYGIENGPVALYLNGNGDASLGQPPLATPQCNVASQTNCDASTPCQLDWSCPLVGALSITVVNGAAGPANNTFFVRWTRIPDTVTSLGTASVVNATGAGQATLVHYSYTAPVLAADQMLIGTLVSQSPSAIMYWSWGVEIAERCLPSRRCTGATCMLSDPCNYAAGTQLYVSVASQQVAYAISLAVQTVPVLPIAANDLATLYEGELTSSSTYVAYRYTLPAGGGLSPANVLQLSVYGVNQGSVLVWANVDALGDTTCAIASALATAGTNAGTALLTIAPCDTYGATALYFMLSPSTQQELCTPITYGLQLTLSPAASAVRSSVALTLGVPVTMPVATSSSLDLYSLTLSNIMPDTVLMVTLVPSDSAAPATPPTVAGMVLATSAAARTATSFCSRAISLTQPLLLMSCELSNATYWISVTSSSAATPLASYTLQASLLRAVNLQTTPGGVYTLPAAQSAAMTVAYLDFTQLWAPSGTPRSLTLELQVLSGPSVDVQLWPATCATAPTTSVLPLAGPLATYTCYEGAPCLMPFAWNSDLYPSRLDIRLATASPLTNYTLAYSTGRNNCHQQPQAANLTFCSGIKYSWWKFADSNNLDASASSAYTTLATAFCPACTCRALSQQCASALQRYACEWMFRPCDTNGYKNTVCGSTCTAVEDACGVTFAEVGLAYLECSHNWYATSSEPACQDNSYVPPDQQPTDNGWSWWAYAAIVAGGLLVILVLVGLIAAVAMALRSRPKAYEIIEGGESENTPLQQ